MPSGTPSRKEIPQGEAHLEGHARAPDDAAQDVAPELVRPEQVALDGARPLSTASENCAEGSGREEARRRRHDHGHRHHDADPIGQPAERRWPAAVSRLFAGERSIDSVRARTMAIVAAPIGAYR
jgi:hypothetical protein